MIDLNKKKGFTKQERNQLMLLGAGSTLITSAVFNLIVNGILKKRVSSFNLDLTSTLLTSSSSFGYMHLKKDDKGKYLGYGSLIGGAGSALINLAIGGQQDPEGEEAVGVGAIEKDFSSSSAEKTEEEIGKVLATEQLTEDFFFGEFQKNDPIPQEYLANVQELANNLQVLRNSLNARIDIISGYRSPRYNNRVGGAKNSQHLFAKASDIMVVGFTPSEVKRAIEKLISEGKMKEGGIGIYDSFVHYDIRGTRARWDSRTK